MALLPQLPLLFDLTMKIHSLLRFVLQQEVCCDVIAFAVACKIRYVFLLFFKSSCIE